MTATTSPPPSEQRLRLLGRDAVEALLTDGNDGAHVSIYLPTHPETLGFQKDPIRLKNLLQEAEEELGKRDLRPHEIDELLAPARGLLQEDQFWKSRGHGVAILLAPGVSHVHRLPLSVKPVSVVSDRFHVKPLLPLVGSSGRFWVLAVSQKDVRLFEGTRYTVREINNLDVPKSLEDVVGYDYEQRSLQFHTGAARNGNGTRRAMFHGHGAANDDNKDEIAEFLRSVDNGVRSLLEGRDEPLVVAAVDYEIAMYRDLSKYDHVLEVGIEGNPEQLSGQELHRAAWRIARPVLTEDRRRAAEQYEQLAGTGKASRQLEEIVPASFDGRVATLFIAPEEDRWGSYDPETRELRREDERSSSDGDLLELAAAQSLLRGAEVHAVPAEDVPGDGVIAAIFRY